MKFVSALNYFSFASYHGYYCIFFKKGTVTWSKTNVTKQNFIQTRINDFFFQSKGRVHTRELSYCFLGDGCLLHKVYIILITFTRYELQKYGNSKWDPPPLIDPHIWYVTNMSVYRYELWRDERNNYI